MRVILCILIGLLAMGTAVADWPMPVAKPPAGARTASPTPSGAVIPWLMHQVPLENIDYYVKAHVSPDTFVRFSPDGRLLAIGTFRGRLLLVDVYTGKTLWARHVSEGIVKRIAFSPDGKVLYFGEQSVDGFIYAADSQTGETLWTFRLADDLKSGRPPEKGDVYGFFHLPGCYRLQVLANGDLLVLGVHVWGDYRTPKGVQRLSRIYRLRPDGSVRWRYPRDAPAPATIIYMDTDELGSTICGLMSSLGGNAKADSGFLPGSIFALNSDGSGAGQHRFPPLTPHFKTVGFWHSVSVSPDGQRAVVGMQDGRSFLMKPRPLKVIKRFDFGAPILIGDVPVGAMATYCHAAADGMSYFQTSQSTVPNVGVGKPIPPPGPHPRANTINAVAADGSVKWRFRSGHSCENFWSSTDGRWLMTTAQKYDNDGHEAGVFLFDTARDGGGSDKLCFLYTVAGNVFFQGDLAADGSALAIVEYPRRLDEGGRLSGRYQVHILR